MFNKNDPLIGAVTKIMEQNEFRREVEKKLCEELGIYSRKALPNEHQANYDALLEQRMKEGLHPNQQKLDVHEPEKDKLTKHDFKMLRAGKKAVSEEEKIDEVLDTKEKKEKYTKAATKSLKDSFGKKDKDSAHTVSKRIYGLSKIKEEMQDSKNPLPPASAKERIQNKLGTGPKSSVDPSYKHQGATASDREEMNKKMEKLDEVSKDTLKKALPGLEKRRFTAKDPGKADQAFKMAKAKLGMPVGSNAGGGKRIPVYMTPKVMAKEEQQLDEVSKDTLKKALPGLEKRRFTAKDPGKADQAFKMAKAKLGMPVGSNAGGGKRIPVYMTPKVMAKEEQQLDEKMSDDDKASVALRKVVAKHKLKDVAKETRPGYVKKQSQEWYNKMTKRANAKVEEEVELDEAAKSKSQHRFFGLVRAIQKGKAEGSEKAEKAAKEMSVKSVRDYAKTKEKGLPEKVKKMDENLSIDDVMEEIARNLGEEKMKQIAERTIRGALNQTMPVDSTATVRSASERDDAEVASQAAANRPAPPKPVAQKDTGTRSAAQNMAQPRPVTPKDTVTRSAAQNTINRTQAPATPTKVSTGIGKYATDERDQAYKPTPPAPAAAPAAAAPRPAAPRPAAPTSAPKPAAAPVDPNAKSKAMFQSYSDKGDDASSADFFRADRQMQKEKPLRESLEHVIRKMHENE